LGEKQETVATTGDGKEKRVSVFDPRYGEEDTKHDRSGPEQNKMNLLENQERYKKKKIR